MLLYSVLTALRPDTFQRAYAVENLTAWKKACFHTAWVLPVTYVITMFTSFGLRIYVPGLTGVETEQALISFFNLSNPIMGVFLLLLQWLHPCLPLIRCCVTSQYLTEDIIKRYRPGKYTDKQLMHIGQLFTVILTIIAIIVTMRP